METDSLAELASFVAAGLRAPEGGAKKRLEALFGERFPKRHFTPTALRDAYGLASADSSDGVPYAGLINGDNPPSGPYGGTSVVWFPTPEGSLIDFGVGTRGLSPDEGILTRPGHRRRIAALRHYLATLGVESWTKPDPAALDVQVPKTVREHFREFDKVFQRYGSELYACARVPRDPEQARKIVQAFIDLYAYERDWEPMKAHQAEFNTFHAALRDSLFSSPSNQEVNALLRQRRFVVLQGPPGTGKTKMAEDVKKQFFDGRGMTVQFHPAFLVKRFTCSSPGDTLLLMPGHAYFLANSEEEFRDRLRYELIPLLDEYLSQGVLGAASTELAAVRDSLEDELKPHA